MGIDNTIKYNILKEKTKILARKYSIGTEFIKYIDNYDFETIVNDKIVSKELAREILLIIEEDTMNMLEKINDFKKCSGIG